MFHSILAKVSRPSAAAPAASRAGSWSLAALVLFSFAACNDRVGNDDAPVRSSVTDQILALDSERTQPTGAKPSTETPADAVYAQRRADGPPRPLRGRVVSRSTSYPEAHCEVSYDGTMVRADENGWFMLPAVRSAGTVRLRMACRGLVERHAVAIPPGREIYELAEPIAVGSPSRADGGAGVAQAVTIGDAIRQMDEERAQSAGATSSFKSTLRGLANFAGTAAAISTAGEKQRYHVLGQWRRAEEAAKARLAADDASDAQGSSVDGGPVRGSALTADEAADGGSSP